MSWLILFCYLALKCIIWSNSVMVSFSTLGVVHAGKSSLSWQGFVLSAMLMSIGVSDYTQTMCSPQVATEDSKYCGDSMYCLNPGLKSLAPCLNDSDPKSMEFNGPSLTLKSTKQQQYIWVCFYFCGIQREQQNLNQIRATMSWLYIACKSQRG